MLLGILTTAATLVIVGGYVMACTLTVEKFEAKAKAQDS